MKKSPNSIDIHVGSRIRMRRVMLGMSQEKLGEGLGITFQQVQKYEKGTNRVGASRLQHISEILNVHVSFFFEGAPGSLDGAQDISISPVSELMNSKEGLMLASSFFAIEDRKLRRKILDLVQSIAGSGMSDADAPLIEEQPVS